MRAGSCFFSRFKNIQWTYVYSTAKGCDAEQQSAPPLQRASLCCPRLSPQQTTTRLLGANSESESARGVSEFQYLNNVTRCANKQHQPRSDLGSTPPLSGSLSLGFLQWGKQISIRIPLADPAFRRCRTIHCCISTQSGLQDYGWAL